jgi:hypothetical protein
MKWLLKALVFRVGFGVLAVFLLWQMFVFLRPRPRPLTAVEVRAAQAVCDLAVQALVAHDSGPMRFGVAHLSGDATDGVTQLLRDALARQPGWTVEQDSVIEKILKDVGEAVARATSFEEVLTAGRRVELDMVVAGRLLALETGTDGVARASVQILAWNVKTGGWALRETFHADWKPSLLDKAKDRLGALSPTVKFVLWLLVILLLPFLTAPVTHWALEKRNNLSSFIVISGYTALGLALGLLIAGNRVLGRGHGLVFLAAFAFCAGYNYWACERIARRAA